MASRRSRIKGIANIPQRRKNIIGQENSKEDSLSSGQNEEKEIIQEPLLETNKLLDNPSPCDSSNTGGELSKKELCSRDPIVNDLNKVTYDESITTKPSENDIVTPSVNTKIDIHEPMRHTPTFAKRRTFLKPAVSASVFNRKPKQNIEKGDSQTPVIEKTSPEIDKPKVFEPQKIIEQNVEEDQPTHKDVSSAGHEVTLDEIHITPEINIPSSINLGTPSGIPEEVPLDKAVKKILPHSSNAPNSDTEYPPPPPSPNKINRSRIKAIPRLGYRKTSFSASESEDESKRHNNRNRNDSVCSTASGVPETITDCFSPQRHKDFSSSIPKKCNRTEQSRKLAEARREFQRRFGANKPDRQRLTMIDLIFYNPTTNPMMNESKSKSDKEEVEDLDENQMEIESKNSGEPQREQENTEETSKSDEENEIPVPQIKIGPSGEIILDEKSLVIENKEVKKQREELQKTKLVDGDFDTGYGIYKKHKRAKEWTHNETLRFYKALNTIGSDFTLMCELFPKRTRRELKQKFKKEERINRNLIDKAMMQPCSFDYAELKHEVDMEEKELEELRKQKEEEIKLKQERQLKKRKAVEKMEQETAENSNSDTKSPKPTAQPKPPKIRKVRKPRLKKLNIESVLEDSDADVSDIATQSESDDEEEIVAPLKPTRSGRIPKVTKKFDTSEEYSIEHIMRRSRMPDTNTNDVEPGSIMIVTEVGANGEPVHKIYMVTADKNATPVNLNSDIVSKAIQFKKGITAQNILTISENVTDDEKEPEQVPEENNVTIPADENVTTLRSSGNACEKSVEEKPTSVSDPLPTENEC